MSRVQKSKIRENSNMYILFQQTLRNMKQLIYTEIGAFHFASLNEFSEFCKEAWKDKYGYITYNADTKQFTQNLKLYTIVDKVKNEVKF